MVKAIRKRMRGECPVAGAGDPGIPFLNSVYHRFLAFLGPYETAFRDSSGMEVADFCELRTKFTNFCFFCENVSHLCIIHFSNGTVSSSWPFRTVDFWCREAPFTSPIGVLGRDRLG